jgi:hypothetical protein
MAYRRPTGTPRRLQDTDNIPHFVNEYIHQGQLTRITLILIPDLHPCSWIWDHVICHLAKLSDGMSMAISGLSPEA